MQGLPQPPENTEESTSGRSMAARVLALLVVLTATQAFAASITVRDGTARPLPGAAVIVYTDAVAGRGTPARSLMDQKNEQFVPDFLVISTGTEVSFPNSDQVLHHVYSFSSAKVFELPLYRGVLPSPIRFDREGIVVIGCNIHDHMIGHIWVVDSTTYALTDAAGHVQFDGVPAGTHRVLAWHPRAGHDGVREGELVVGADGSGDMALVLTVAKPISELGALSWHDAY